MFSLFFKAEVHLNFQNKTHRVTTGIVIHEKSMIKDPEEIQNQVFNIMDIKMNKANFLILNYLEPRLQRSKADMKINDKLNNL